MNTIIERSENLMIKKAANFMKKREEKRQYKSTDAYKAIRLAGVTFLFCIIFEVAGIMMVPFFGILGAQIAIYFMTFVFGLALAVKHKDLDIKIEKPKAKTMGLLVVVTLCGIPIAMLLNAFANMISNSGADQASDILSYPIYLSILAYALLPAVVEELIFRGIIVGCYKEISTVAAVLISSIFFAMLHFSFGSVLYGFFFGLVFSLVRLGTGNLLYTMVMHFVFNAFNVWLSYMDVTKIPGAAIIGYLVVGVIMFVILFIRFFKQYPVELTRSAMKKRRMISKEGWVASVICAVVIGALFVV